MLENLTHDEQAIRTYYLTEDFSSGRNLFAELPYLAPVAILTLMPKREEGDVSLYIALAYLAVVYLWRTAGTRWLRATSTLVKKYEAKLAEPPQPAVKTR